MIRGAWAALAAACLAGSGCIDSSTRPDEPPRPTTVPFDTRAVHEDPGAAVVSGVAERSVLAATPGGGEIIHEVDRMGPRTSERWLVGTDLGDGSRRDLADWPVWQDVLALTPDGAGLYYSAYDPVGLAGLVLRDAYSATNVDLGGREPVDFVASGDSAWLLVGAVETGGGFAEQTLAVERATGALIPTPCSSSSGAVFSPAGDEVLCATNSPELGTVLIRFGLHDRVARPVHGLARCGGGLHAVRWTGAGIQAACLDGQGLLVGDPETGEEIASTPAAGWLDVAAKGFSPDGSGLAFVSSHCLAGLLDETEARIVVCTRLEWHVQVFDLVRRQARLIASSGGAPGGIVFSSDGATLFYVLGTAIHARPSGL